MNHKNNRIWWNSHIFHNSSKSHKIRSRLRSPQNFILKRKPQKTSDRRKLDALTQNAIARIFHTSRWLFRPATRLRPRFMRFFHFDRAHTHTHTRPGHKRRKILGLLAWPRSHHQSPWPRGLSLLRRLSAFPPMYGTRFSSSWPLCRDFPRFSIISLFSVSVSILTCAGISKNFAPVWEPSGFSERPTYFPTLFPFFPFLFGYFFLSFVGSTYSRLWVLGVIRYVSRVSFRGKCSLLPISVPKTSYCSLGHIRIFVILYVLDFLLL